MRNWFLICCCLLTVFSYGQTDAKVEAVYTLGKIPAPLAVFNHIVQARITNVGNTTLTDLAVVLNISGANIFTDTQRITLNATETIVVNFTAHSLWNPSINTVTASVPDDDNNLNNSAAYTQIVNSNTFSYADESPTIQSLGYGSGEGMLLTKYTVSGSGIVKQVKVHISNQAANIGNTVYGVVTMFETIVGQSAPHIITAADLGTYVTFDITEQPAVDAEFYAGLLQTVGTTEHYPVSYQEESIPTRPDAYFASLADGSGLTSLDFIGRLMIQAVVDIGTNTPFNTASSAINYTLAGWDFSGAASPVNFAATTFDTSLASSNLISRGPGAAATAGIHTFRTNGFQNNGISTSNTDYFQVAVSPKPGDVLSLATLTGYVHANNNIISTSGVNSQFAYSLDGANFTLIGSPFQLFDCAGSFAVDVSGIPALQQITPGTTVTFRYYASGEAANGDWGFVSLKPGSDGLAINGHLQTSNSIRTSPVVPTGASFMLPDCSSSPTGSIAFNSTGTFSADNKYIVQLGRIYQPTGFLYRFRSPETVGFINSNANAGTINFTIPPGSLDFGEYAVRVISTNPYVAGSFSQSFSISGPYCKSQPENKFRSRASGDWTNLTTWESTDGNSWIPATLIPDDIAAQVEIVYGTTVEIKSNVAAKNVAVRGKLKLINDVVNKGVLTLNAPSFPSSNSMQVDTAGILEIVSAIAGYNDAILFVGGKIRVAGKISIGTGATPVAAGFDAMANKPAGVISWVQGSVFEWNNTTPFLTDGATYFPDNFGPVTFRLTNIAAANLGGAGNTDINGLLEVNTPVTWTGAGVKTFRDGIKGTAILNQATGSGKFFVSSFFEDIPASNFTNAVKTGIIGGKLKINLSTAGLTLDQGIAIPDTSKVIISGGPVTAFQSTVVQPGAELTLDPGTVFTLENGNLLNDGLLKGAGTFKFTGSNVSLLSSPGLISAPVLLDNKELSLAANSNISDLSLTAISHVQLEKFNLYMRSSALGFDAQNFIITNDTGRLSRSVATTSVVFPVGISSSSYTPVTLTNTGTADNIKAGVVTGVQAAVPVTTENVNRTWNIGDTAMAGINLSITAQWTAADEQPDFDRSRCYISHYTSCLPTGTCPDYFDVVPAGAASGSTIFTTSRSGITNFKTPAFIVTSKRFVYSFTGNGDWNTAANWTPAVVAPVIIPAGVEVYIDPVVAGECLYNGNIKVKQGGSLKVRPGKNLRITGDLTVE